jgi:hypothetical protein
VLTDFTTKADLGGRRDDVAYAVAVQSDGKIVVIGGSSDAKDASAFALVRYTADGLGP